MQTQYTKGQGYSIILNIFTHFHYLCLLFFAPLSLIVDTIVLLGFYCFHETTLRGDKMIHFVIVFIDFNYTYIMHNGTN